MPPGRSKSGTLPDDIRGIESAQMRCPGGHLLPHRTNRGSCTPVYCPGSAAGATPTKAAESYDSKPTHFATKGAAKRASKLGAEALRAKKQAIEHVSTEADAMIDSMIQGDSPAMVAARAAAKSQKVEELTKLGHAVGRYAALRAFFKVPEGLEGAQAEDYVQKRALMLSVDALAEVERQLKLGDDSQRREAARDILDMNGMRRREQSAGGGPVIMLINPNGGGSMQLPWVQRMPIGAVPSKEQLKDTNAITPEGPSNA